MDLRSRNDRPLSRYFPEVVDALRALPGYAAVLDGELVVDVRGRPDFPALLARLHPAASRVAELAACTPARLVAFDVLAVGSEALLDAPFSRRRPALEALLAASAPSTTGTLALSPSTSDRALAEAWLRTPPPGVDGVVAKSPHLRYEPGRRTMLKVKLERSADCVVGGVRVAGDPPGVASLLLGLHDDRDRLCHVGVASSFTAVRRRELLEELLPWACPLDAHPWRHGFGEESGATARLPGAASRWTPDLPLDWVPLRPERVAEVAYDHVESGRFRHPARFRRWRPDRDATSCRADQLAAPAEG